MITITTSEMRNVLEHDVAYLNDQGKLDYLAAFDALVRERDEAQARLLNVKCDTFQADVQPWMLKCFGAAIAADKIERNHRFFEEATEAVQANGMTRSEAHQLVDYTFDRPVGELNQEIGGVMVTLAALCLASGVDMHVAGETELARIWGKIEQIRAKQAAKPKHSPLPEHISSSASAAPVLTDRHLKYFVHDPYHGEFHECTTDKERQEKHDEWILTHLDGQEWDEGAGDIVSGVITHKTRESIELVEDIGESYTYTQEALAAPVPTVAREPLVLWQEGTGMLWDTFSHGKWVHRFVSPHGWDAHAVAQHLYGKGYAGNLEVHAVWSGNDATKGADHE